MTVKRADQLSLRELAVAGAAASRKAVVEAHKAGLTTTGTLDARQDGVMGSVIAKVSPDGTVKIVNENPKRRPPANHDQDARKED